jgi:membrane protease YdiL (CAAX protease family)
LWLPALYLGGLGALGLVTGKLEPLAVTMVLINTAIVGFSEELAFRGVLWGAARKALSFWTGFVLVSLAFGSVHVFNAILTGELAAAGVQALNAFMSGAAYLAIRIRTRSIIPIMVIHATWDFVVFLAGSGGDGASGDPASLQQQLTFGLILTGPLFLYGLWLVRNESVRAGWRDDGIDPLAHPAGDR